MNKIWQNLIMCFCDCFTDWVTDVWTHGFIDAPLIPNDVKDSLSDNMDLSNKLAELHDLLLLWALDQQHSSAQSKLHSKVWFVVLLNCFLFMWLKEGYFLSKGEETKGMCKWFKWSWSSKWNFSNSKADGERKDITGSKCLKQKGVSGKVIVDDKGIKDSWKEYMEKLMNEENEWDHRISAGVKRRASRLHQDQWSCCNIEKDEEKRQIPWFVRASTFYGTLDFVRD